LHRDNPLALRIVGLTLIAAILVGGGAVAWFETRPVPYIDLIEQAMKDKKTEEARLDEIVTKQAAARASIAEGKRSVAIADDRATNAAAFAAASDRRTKRLMAEAQRAINSDDDRSSSEIPGMDELPPMESHAAENRLNQEELAAAQQRLDAAKKAEQETRLKNEIIDREH
jgi:phage-related minor tail protein